MKIYILDEILEIEGKKFEFDNLMNKINGIMFEKKNKFSHLIIDGLEIYNNMEIYVDDNKCNIENMKVVFLDNKDYLRDILISTMDYLSVGKTLIENLGKKFYTENKSENFIELSNLLEGINWIISTFNYIDSDEELKNIVNSLEDWNLYVKQIYELADTMETLESGIVNKDNILIGDILTYEIAPKFEAMNKHLINLLKVEVK